MAGSANLTVEMVTFDCTEPDRLADWWSTALGGTVVPVVPGEFLMVACAAGPRLGFQRVDDPTPGKARIHLDFATPDVEAEIARLVELGAAENLKRVCLFHDAPALDDDAFWHSPFAIQPFVDLKTVWHPSALH